MSQCDNFSVSHHLYPVSHNSSVGEQMYLVVCPLCGLRSIACRSWQKRAQYPLNGITQPVDIEEEGRSPTMDS